MEAKADKIDKNLYRKSTLGEALNTCLIDLKERQEINEDTKIQIEREFDNQIKKAFENLSKSTNPPKGTTSDYRNCDNFWSFVIPSSIIKIDMEDYKSEKCKIIAFENESCVSKNRNKRTGKAAKNEGAKKKKLN